MNSIDVNITNMIKWGDQRLILVCANTNEADKLESRNDKTASFFLYIFILSQLRE